MSNDSIEDVTLLNDHEDETLDRWAFYFFLGGIAFALFAALWVLLQTLLS